MFIIYTPPFKSGIDVPWLPPAKTVFYRHLFLLFSLSYCELLEGSSYVSLVFKYLGLKSESGTESMSNK